MCGRFTLLADELALRKRFLFKNDVTEVKERYNIAPSERVFAIICDDSIRRGGFIQWGLVPFWAKDKKIGHRMINARVETVHEKPSFKHLLTRRRCLIVADSFYEWKTNEVGKSVHRIHLENESLFGFAGLWDKWERDGEILFTCTIITTEANEYMRPIHHRMPIIIPRNQEDIWLSHQFDHPYNVQQFLMSVHEPQFTSYEVSTYVNNAQHDDIKCIEPTSL